MRKIALITGATSGIGRATAKILAENTFDIIITGRRENKLLELKKDIENKTDMDVLSLCFDVRKNKEVSAAIASLKDKWKDIDVLVNNAGLAAGLAKIHEGSIDDWEQMIDTNIKGLLYMTRAVSPNMVSRNFGHIINIGSIAGKEVYENGNVYCGTKYAVDALTKGSRIDLADYNVKVTSINPGAVETEFSMIRFKGDREKANSIYKGFTPLYEQDIAEAVLFAATRPPHVNINELTIMPTAQPSGTKIVRQ